MPRVSTKTKFNMGREYKCGRCGKTIAPGDQYHSWKFRYGGMQVRCADHYPRRGELTQSKLGPLYDAIDDALEQIQTADIEDLQGILESATETGYEVAQEYRDAAEAMGGAGYEMEERADEIEGWCSEVEQWEAPDSDFDEDDLRDEVAEEIATEMEAELEIDLDDEGQGAFDEMSPVDRVRTYGDEAEFESRLDDAFQERLTEHRDGEDLDAARESATEVLDGFPL